ncbi:hypothetical protein T12_8504 [Trichinella patagoniensis]|uniref:Uncharacterized protein n=1 Tax=Trichinella patagoniensis TaxID=990121 RepID=A0A0V0ZAI8_9BILA|nr:hypothetical protein T12_8504 [Trichinella patagoniensis]
MPSAPFDLAMVIWRARPSGGFFKYFIDAQLTQWPRNAHPSTSAHAVSLTTAGAARCRDNDLADDVRALSSSYPRLLASSPWPGHTDYVGVVPFGTMLMMFLLAIEPCRIMYSGLYNFILAAGQMNYDGLTATRPTFVHKRV